MARKSILIRESRKEKLVDKHHEQRKSLKTKMKAASNLDEMMGLQVQLAKLPLNSNPVRHTTRCMQCGRSRAVYRKFKLCRICLRQYLMTGYVPGGRKSSW
ncbi:MAG: 30S ribosomal protein S14 [Gammaproteobacteria bacterium]|nr:30S ribosomal protein S14 [Gammaproteobacteria bacterium]